MLNKTVIKKGVKYFYWGIYGRTISNPHLPSLVKSLLFVCQGNICRSPFAEKIAVKHHCCSNKYSFYSAGIQAAVPISPPDEAIIAAKKFGVNLEQHKSRQIDNNILKSFDMIISMETWQHKYLIENYNELSDRMFLLPLYDNKIENKWDQYSIYNIKDPYGKNVIEFTNCYHRINRCIGEMVSFIEGDHQGAKA